jgi:hypothetical protein
MVQRREKEKMELAMKIREKLEKYRKLYQTFQNPQLLTK